MEGQQVYQKVRNGVCREEPMLISAPQDHSHKNLDLSIFFHQLMEQGYAPFLNHFGSSRYDDSEKKENLCQEVFAMSKGRKTVYFSLVSPLDPYPDPKHKPYLHLKNHHGRWFVIDLEEVHNSLEFDQTANGSVRNVIQFRPCSSPRSSTSKTDWEGS